MIKEEKNIDFYTTGRQPSEEEFAQISEWIKKNKEKQKSSRKERIQRKSTLRNEPVSASQPDTTEQSN